MNHAYSGKVAIVTGAASGIGRALSEELARRKVEVIVADRQESLAQNVAAAIREAGGNATAHALDVRDHRAFRELAESSAARRGRIDYLFNNAGIVVGGEVLHHTAQDWDDVIDVNVRGVAYGVQAVYPIMVKQGCGHIVNTSSTAGLMCIPGGSYPASKYAVTGLSRSMRVEGKRYGVKVSVVCPGLVRTPMFTGGVFGRMNLPNVSEERVAELLERVRPMSTSEFAPRVLDAVARNEAIIVLPRWWKALWYLERISPALSARLWRTIGEGIEMSTKPGVLGT